MVSCIDRCDLIGCCVLRDRAPPEMEEQEREVLDWEAELAKQNIPYIDTDEANMVRANQSSHSNHSIHYTVVRCKLGFEIVTCKLLQIMVWFLV